MFEVDQFAGGNEALARAIAAPDAFSIAGGGDTLAAIDKYSVAGDIFLFQRAEARSLSSWKEKCYRQWLSRNNVRRKINLNQKECNQGE